MSDECNCEQSRALKLDLATAMVRISNQDALLVNKRANLDAVTAERNALKLKCRKLGLRLACTWLVFAAPHPSAPRAFNRWHKRLCRAKALLWDMRGAR